MKHKQEVWKVSLILFNLSDVVKRCKSEEVMIRLVSTEQCSGCCSGDFCSV